MEAIQQLQDDHRAFRELLEGIERAVNDAAHPELVIRGCAALAARLRMHIRREGQLSVLCSRVLGRSRPDTLAPLDVEHHPEAHDLQALLRALRRDPVMIEPVRGALSRLAADLCRHMSEQETGLFPFFEQVFLGRREALDAARLRVVKRWTAGRTRLHSSKLEGLKSRRVKRGAGTLEPGF
jgi:hypothetical protein